MAMRQKQQLMQHRYCRLLGGLGAHTRSFFAFFVGIMLHLGDVQAESPRVETSLSVAETFTDNASAGRNGESDWITEISPTVSIRRSGGGHVIGSVDASFRNLIYANDNSQNSSFITLNGNAQIEAIDDSLFVDIQSSISRDNLSSFRGRPQWDGRNADSRSETRYMSISPRWVGRIGKGDTQFSISYSGQALSYGSDLSGQSMGTFRARVFDPTAGEVFGWSLDYEYSENAYQDDSGEPDFYNNQLTGTLTYYVSTQFSLRMIAGTEKNNYKAGEDDSGAITGYGLRWTPTPRTIIDGTVENHVYGDTYDVRISHRRSLFAIDLGLSRDISSAYQTATNTIGSYYYRLFSSALVPRFPDPVQRDQATRELMRALGIPTAGSFGNFATNAFFVDQRIQAGLTLIGSRNSIGFSTYRSDRSDLDSGAQLSPDDDFANNDNIKSWGWTVSANHQLTPNSGLNAAVYWSTSKGSGGGASEGSRDQGLRLGYSKQVGAKTFGSVSYFHEKSSGDDSFTENSVTASLIRSF
jgi:uncharacterized protein (PEP-CTERM system associated)